MILSILNKYIYLLFYKIIIKNINYQLSDFEKYKNIMKVRIESNKIIIYNSRTDNIR